MWVDHVDVGDHPTQPARKIRVIDSILFFEPFRLGAVQNGAKLPDGFAVNRWPVIDDDSSHRLLRALPQDSSLGFLDFKSFFMSHMPNSSENVSNHLQDD